MRLERIHFWTMLFLILHQVDAAFWKEWEMFGLPGGIQAFLVFNALAVPVLLVGYQKLINRDARWRVFSYACGGLGVLTFGIHAGFALGGHAGFDLPLSRLIIGMCLVFGVWQLIETGRTSSES